MGFQDASVLASASTFEADSNDDGRNLSATPEHGLPSSVFP